MVDKHAAKKPKSHPQESAEPTDKRMIFFTTITIIFVLAVLIGGIFLALGLTQGR